MIYCYNGYAKIKIVKTLTEFFIPRKTIQEILNNSKASRYAARSTKKRKGISKTSVSHTKQKYVRGLIVETRKYSNKIQKESLSENQNSLIQKPKISQLETRNSVVQIYNLLQILSSVKECRIENIYLKNSIA